MQAIQIWCLGCPRRFNWSRVTWNFVAVDLPGGTKPAGFGRFGLRDLPSRTSDLARFLPSLGRSQPLSRSVLCIRAAVCHATDTKRLTSGILPDDCVLV